MTVLVHQNGRYLYSFRGGASNVLDVYDIAANTWISGIAYGQQMETFTAGSCSVDLDGELLKVECTMITSTFRLSATANPKFCFLSMISVF